MTEQFKREVIGRRVEVLQAMDYAIRYMNDEDAMEPWLMCGVPDGAELEDYEDMAIGLVSEFTNIISGHAVTALSEYHLDISPPFCVIGHNHMISWPRNYPIIAIPFVTPYGPFEVDVCFK